jgi:hypothetical protein
MVFTNGKTDPIPFCPRLFAGKSERYSLQTHVSPFTNIDIEFDLEPDSVVQFRNACEDREFCLTRENVFGFELLCNEWEVTDEVIREKIVTFTEHENLEVGRLLFHIKHGLATSAIEEGLCPKLYSFVGHDALLRIPLTVIDRIVDFRHYDATSAEHRQLFTICIDYFRAHGPVASVLFRTLDLATLTTEHLGRLRSLNGLLWSFLNGSVVQTIIDQDRLIRDLQDQHRRQIQDLQSQHERQIRVLQSQHIGQIQNLQSQHGRQIRVPQSQHIEQNWDLRANTSSRFRISRASMGGRFGFSRANTSSRIGISGDGMSRRAGISSSLG